MLTKQSSTQRNQLEIVALDQLVPEDHLVRKIESAIGWRLLPSSIKIIITFDKLKHVNIGKAEGIMTSEEKSDFIKETWGTENK